MFSSVDTIKLENFDRHVTESAVQELPETRESLLLQIREPENRRAWEEFVEIYRPVVYRFALSKGLQHADAMDLVQTVFIAVANSINRWEKHDQQSRFRHWLLRVARNATINAVTRRPKDQPAGGDLYIDELVNHPVDQECASQIETEYQRELYLRAAEQVRASVHQATWQAFELTAINGMPIDEAADELGKSVGSVYAARSRIMKQLADIVSQLEDSYR